MMRFHSMMLLHGVMFFNSMVLLHGMMFFSNMMLHSVVLHSVVLHSRRRSGIGSHCGARNHHCTSNNCTNNPLH